jgi:tripartite motif-containing protein 71
MFGMPGHHGGQFQMPREVAFAPDGSELYILDRSHRVQVFSPEGRYLRGWQTPFGPLGNPRGMDVDKRGRLYVADTHNSQILVYDRTGGLLRQWGRPGKAPGEFTSVTDVAVARDGSVWACEYGAYNDRVQKFDAKGRLLLTVGSFGDRPGQFNRPQGIAVEARTGNIFVADAVNHRVQVLAPDGTLLRVMGSAGTAPGMFRYPYDVEFDAAGRLYVAEFGNCRISVFSPEGRFLAAIGGPGRAPGQFDHPWGVGVAQDGEVFVADTMNYRIQRFPPLWPAQRRQTARTGRPAPPPR